MIIKEYPSSQFPNQKDIELMTEKDLRLWLRNESIYDEKGKSKPLSDVWLRSPSRRQYGKVVFEPGESVKEGQYNLWQGFAVEPAKGECKLYLKHIHDNICKGNMTYYKYLISWMADAVQNPIVKPGIAVVVKGEKGTGKNVFIENFGKLFGIHYKQIAQSSHLTGNFNSHLKDTLLLFANEAFWAGDKQGENVLKTYITEDTMIVEPKGQNSFTVANRMRIMMASNNDWVVPASIDERRFFVLDVGNKHQNDTKYFKEIVDEMENGGREALLYYLLNLDLSGVNLRKPPVTDALIEQKLKSMNSVYKFWFELLVKGQLQSEHNCWDDSISVDALYQEYSEWCRQKNIRNAAERREFGRAISKVCPDRERLRTGTDTREYTYEFPELDKCRELFEDFIGSKITWSFDISE